MFNRWKVAGVTLGQAVPVLASKDFDETVDFYTNTLGFKLKYQSEQYLVISRDITELHFCLCNCESAEVNTACYIHQQNLDGLHKELKLRGLKISPPINQPWGARELDVKDPHGNCLRFGEQAVI